jgi:translation initiation factor 3 subunit F
VREAQLLTAADTPLPTTDLAQLEASLEGVLSMLDRVLGYVRGVLAGEQQGDAALGRYLMDAFGAAAEDIEKGGFASSLQVRPAVPAHVGNETDDDARQDTLMLSYLANLARAQAELSSRLALVSAA